MKNKIGDEYFSHDYDPYNYWGISFDHVPLTGGIFEVKFDHRFVDLRDPEARKEWLKDEPPEEPPNQIIKDPAIIPGSWMEGLSCDRRKKDSPRRNLNI